MGCVSPGTREGGKKVRVFPSPTLWLLQGFPLGAREMNQCPVHACWPNRSTPVFLAEIQKNRSAPSLCQPAVQAPGPGRKTIPS